MSPGLPDSVGVFLDAAELGPRRRIGTLRQVGRRANTPVMFAYDRNWVQDPAFFLIDPAHQPHGGDQLPPDGGMAGIFTDTSPDRWGRMLLERREADQAVAEGRRSRVLGEWDFLLGVNDHLRMGALRFAAADDAPFFDSSPSSVPPVAELRELEAAVREVEQPSGGGHRPDLRAAVALLLAPGSPLGGARPKTSFSLDDGALWLAKFPSRNDRRDVGAWEFVLNELARRAGIEVPETRLLQLGGAYHTFAARRFDRAGEDRRLFASAMTMVGKRDREPASYVEIAEAISDNGAPGWIGADLAQLFRREIFNILVGHRDDHLRNHGFLRHPEGWRLAPAYDLNPMPDLTEHELAIGIDSHAPSVELALGEVAPFCRLKPRQAEQIVADVRSAIIGWQELATRHGLPRHEIDVMASAITP
jgi:serine/threonine-protein kinase HipA